MNQKKKKRLYIFNSNWVKPTIIAIGFIMIIVGLSSSLFQSTTEESKERFLNDSSLFQPTTEESKERFLNDSSLFQPTIEESKERFLNEMKEGLEIAMHNFESEKFTED